MEEEFSIRLSSDIDKLSIAQNEKSELAEQQRANAQQKTAERLDALQRDLQSGHDVIQESILKPIAELQASLRGLSSNFTELQASHEKDLRSRIAALEEEKKDTSARLKYKEEELSALKNASDEKVERLRAIIDEVP